jgi:RpiR family carbohydrate utilization transcriptional regulator
MPEDVLAAIRAAVPGLSPAEAKVAAAVLGDPETAMRSSISLLARAAGVSEPTVNRFCRSLGHDGYAAFRLALARGLGRGTPYISPAVSPGDPPEVYARRIFDAAAEALRRARDALDPAAIGAAVAAMRGARQILFFGLGGSGPVALDAQHKFVRLDIPAVAYNDPIMQRMAAMAVRPGDVVLAVSSTGRTRQLVENVELARDGGAVRIGLTRPGSPLARASGIVLGVEPVEDSDLYTPMGSRLVHLAVIDVLLTGVVLGRGPEILAQLARIKQGLNDTRLPA